MTKPTPGEISPEQLEKMRRDWDDRARENARHYVDTSRTDWTDEAFFASGEQQDDITLIVAKCR